MSEGLHNVSDNEAIDIYMPYSRYGPKCISLGELRDRVVEILEKENPDGYVNQKWFGKHGLLNLGSQIKLKVPYYRPPGSTKTDVEFFLDLIPENYRSQLNFSTKATGQEISVSTPEAFSSVNDHEKLGIYSPYSKSKEGITLGQLRDRVVEILEKEKPDHPVKFNWFSKHGLFSLSNQIRKKVSYYKPRGSQQSDFDFFLDQVPEQYRNLLDFKEARKYGKSKVSSYFRPKKYHYDSEGIPVPQNVADRLVDLLYRVDDEDEGGLDWFSYNCLDILPFEAYDKNLEKDLEKCLKHHVMNFSGIVALMDDYWKDKYRP